MGVSTFVQPDFTGQTATVYKTSIDDGIAVHHQIAGPFAPHEQAVPDLTVRLDAAIFGDLVLGDIITHAAQDTGTLSAPSVDPRKDIIYVDWLTGDVGVATGAEDSSPVDPTVPANKLPVGRINWTIGMTEITNTDLDDIRALGGLGLSTAAFINVGTTDGLIPTLNADGGLTLTDTDNGPGSGPEIQLYRNNSAGAVNDFLGTLRIRGKDDGGNDRDYVLIRPQITNPADGSEQAKLEFLISNAGAILNIITLEEGLQIGAPDDGDKGPGTVNAENGFFDDGIRLIGKVAVYDFIDTSNTADLSTIPTGTLWSSSQEIDIPTSGLIQCTFYGRINNTTGGTRRPYAGIRINGTDYWGQFDENGTPQEQVLGTNNNIASGEYRIIQGGTQSMVSFDIEGRGISTGVQTVQPIAANSGAAAGVDLVGATVTARFKVTIADMS